MCLLYICPSYNVSRILQRAYLLSPLNSITYRRFCSSCIGSQLNIGLIQYKIGLLTFKAIHFKTPQYLSNLLSIKGNNRFSLRSASNGLILEDPTCRYKVTLGDRSFRASAPKTWNTLPKGIRDQTNILTFKTMLKTHLFRMAYSNFL